MLVVMWLVRRQRCLVDSCNLYFFLAALAPQNEGALCFDDDAPLHGVVPEHM